MPNKIEISREVFQQALDPAECPTSLEDFKIKPECKGCDGNFELATDCWLV